MSAFVKFLEEIFPRGLERRRGNTALWQVTAQFPAPRMQILHFRAILWRPVKSHFGEIFITNWNPKACAEPPHLIFIQLFLLMGNVFPFSALTEPISFNGSRQNHCGRSGMFDRRLISC